MKHYTDEYLDINYLKDSNDRIYEQLSYAEAKHAVLIGFIGATIFALIGIVVDLGMNYCNLIWLQIWIGVTAGLLLFPLIVSFSSFYPNTKRIGIEKNLYFYGDISKYENVENYLADIKDCHNIEKHLAAQNMQVSSIIVKKHFKFTLALNLCLASFIPLHYIWTIIFTIMQMQKNKIKK